MCLVGWLWDSFRSESWGYPTDFILLFTVLRSDSMTQIASSSNLDKRQNWKEAEKKLKIKTLLFLNLNQKLYSFPLSNGRGTEAATAKLFLFKYKNARVLFPPLSSLQTNEGILVNVALHSSLISGRQDGARH
jgi:hypothetical protein